MMIYQLGSARTTMKVSGYHDPDNIRPFVLTLKPTAWVAATVYQTGDIVVPSTFKGLAYECVNPGKSHASTEPTWALTLDDTTDDFEAGKTEGLTWKAIAYQYLPVDEDVDTVTADAVTITCTNGATTSAKSLSTSAVNFTIDTVASDAEARTEGAFDIRIRIATTSGRRFDVTLTFTLAEG